MTLRWSAVEKQWPDQTLFITEKGRNFIDGPYHLTNSNARWTRNTSNIKLAFITITSKTRLGCGTKSMLTFPAADIVKLYEIISNDALILRQKAD